MAKECTFRSFFASMTKAEEREAANRRRAEKQAEYEARQQKKAEQQAKFEAKQAAYRKKLGLCEEDNESVASTAASSYVMPVDDSEVERLTAADKQVRKFQKILRDIEKLEALDESELEKLQKEKIGRKDWILSELNFASCVARLKAREELKLQRQQGSA
jgi:hypothetical protein